MKQLENGADQTNQGHKRSVLWWSTAVLGALLITAPAVHAEAHAATDERSGILTVHEGTDMAVTASPDHKTLIIDLQGMLYTLPASGGSAKRITAPELEASHPNWSP